MDIGEGQIRGAFFDYSVVESALFCIFQMLPSGSKIIPVDPEKTYTKVKSIPNRLCNL